jgi:antitoxin (DNA-binding transcriptional repressor) of toxin-antitoxin stability system
MGKTLKTVGIVEAKNHFSRLVRRAETGETIKITRAGKVVAELGPSRSAPRPFGIDEGKVHIAADFDAPLPADIADN